MIRCVGDDHEPAKFSTWAPKVVRSGQLQHVGELATHHAALLELEWLREELKATRDEIEELRRQRDAANAKLELTRQIIQGHQREATNRTLPRFRSGCRGATTKPTVVEFAAGYHKTDESTSAVRADLLDALIEARRERDQARQIIRQ